MSREEVPKYLIFAEKTVVRNYVWGVDDHVSAQEGWAAHYSKESHLVVLEDVNTDEIKKRDIEYEQSKLDRKSKDAPIHAEDIEYQMHNEAEGDIFHSDVETAIGCEDDEEFKEQANTRKNEHEPRGGTILQRIRENFIPARVGGAATLSRYDFSFM